MWGGRSRLRQVRSRWQEIQVRIKHPVKGINSVEAVLNIQQISLKQLIFNNRRKHSQKHGRHRPTHTHVCFSAFVRTLAGTHSQDLQHETCFKPQNQETYYIPYGNSSSQKATLEVRAHTSGQTNYEIITAREKTPPMPLDRRTANLSTFTLSWIYLYCI